MWFGGSSAEGTLMEASKAPTVVGSEEGYPLPSRVGLGGECFLVFFVAT